jgi:hypothetical protein
LSNFQAGDGGFAAREGERKKKGKKKKGKKEKTKIERTSCPELCGVVETGKSGLYEGEFLG